MRAKNAGRSTVSPGRRARRRDRRSVAAQAAAGPVPPVQRRLHPRLPHHRRLARRPRRGRLPQGRARRARRVLHPQGRRGRLGRLRREPRLRAAGRRGRRAAGGRRGPKRSLAGESRRLHYLSVPPNAALSGGADAGRSGPRRLAHRHGKALRHRPRERGVAERKLHEVFAEEQIFRIDHFLGKEPAQNILAFRFANGLFEPIWNRNFIDHVQIDVPETLGLGKRAGFYERSAPSATWW